MTLEKKIQQAVRIALDAKIAQLAADQVNAAEDDIKDAMSERINAEMDAIRKANEAKDLTPRRIQEIVALTWEIDIDKMLSKTREHRYCWPRMASMALCRAHTQRGVTALGEIFDVDHATICNAAKNIPDLVDQDKEFRAKYELAETRIKNILNSYMKGN